MNTTDFVAYVTEMLFTVFWSRAFQIT